MSPWEVGFHNLGFVILAMIFGGLIGFAYRRTGGHSPTFYGLLLIVGLLLAGTINGMHPILNPTFVGFGLLAGLMVVLALMLHGMYRPTTEVNRHIKVKRN